MIFTQQIADTIALMLPGYAVCYWADSESGSYNLLKLNDWESMFVGDNTPLAIVGVDIPTVQGFTLLSLRSGPQWERVLIDDKGSVIWTRSKGACSKIGEVVADHLAID